jgi:cation transport ATPase
MEADMSEERQYDEKEEKEVNKHDEKVEERDMLSSIVWAFILIWAGLVFLASNMGWFEVLNLSVDTSWTFRSLDDWRSFGVWNLIALGAGAIVLLEALVRLLVPNFRRHVGGTLIAAAVLITIGLGGWFSWGYLWPLILIAVGVNVLLTGLKRKQ